MKTVEFTAMKDGTREDYLFLKPLEDEHVKGTGDRVLRELRLQEDETLPGYKIITPRARPAGSHAGLERWCGHRLGGGCPAS